MDGPMHAKDKRAKVRPCVKNMGTKGLRDNKEMHTRMESQGGVRDYTNY